VTMVAHIGRGRRRPFRRAGAGATALGAGKQGREWGFSPCCDASVAQEGDGDAAVAEIEVAAAGSGIGRSSMLCPGERWRLRGTGSPWAVHVTGEDEESPGKVSTGIEGGSKHL
jgi:hypothetical protein